MQININDADTFEEKWWLVELDCESPFNSPYNYKLDKEYFSKVNQFTLSFVVKAKDRAEAKELASVVAYHSFTATEDISSIKMLDKKVCEGISYHNAKAKVKLNNYDLV